MAHKVSAKEAARRKKLSEKIDRLGSIEHGEIFRKLKHHNLGYTQNSNGIFFDITNVPGPIIDDLLTFVDHCIENQKMLKTSRQEQFVGNSKDPGRPPEEEKELFEEHFEVEEGEEESAEGDATRPESKAPEQKPSDPPPQKKPSSKFQHTRKKYSRPVASKVTYANDLRRE